MPTSSHATAAARACGHWTGQQVAEQFSTARPAHAPRNDDVSHRRAVDGSTCNVLVLDTGAFPSITAAGASTFTANSDAAMAYALLESGIVSFDVEMWDGDGNMILDAFAGHGTFIAGLIANLAPGAKITVAAGLSTFGDTDDAAIAEALLARFPEGGGDDPPFDVVSMSFGGFCESDDPPIAMSKAIASIQSRYRTVDADDPTIIRERVIFVASAGNAGSCRPTWPASFENVIAVGALGPDGKAWFSNYGPWVDACAPGVDIVSCFFDLGEEAGDAEDFNGWASWSGTIVLGTDRGSRDRLGVDVPRWPRTRGRRADDDVIRQPGHAAAWLTRPPRPLPLPLARHRGQSVLDPFRSESDRKRPSRTSLAGRPLLVVAGPASHLAVGQPVIP